MRWFRMDVDLPDSPKVLRLGRLLKITKLEALGHYVSLCCWVGKFAPDGDLAKFDALDLAAACAWSGDEAVIVDALKAAKVIDGEPGEWALHGWSERQDQAIKKQMSKAQREKARIPDGRSTTWQPTESHPAAGRLPPGSRPVAGPTVRYGTERNDEDVNVVGMGGVGGEVSPPAITTVSLSDPLESLTMTELARAYVGKRPLDARRVADVFRGHNDPANEIRRFAAHHEGRGGVRDALRAAQNWAGNWRPSEKARPPDPETPALYDRHKPIPGHEWDVYEQRWTPTRKLAEPWRPPGTRATGAVADSASSLPAEAKP